MRRASSSFGYQVAQLVLFIPHSIATEERIFSMVRKNKPASHPSLEPKGTLSERLNLLHGNIIKPIVSLRNENIDIIFVKCFV